MSDWLIQPPFDLERDDWGATLLREWASAEIQPGSRVMIIGAGAGAVGVPLARAGIQVTFVDDSLAALQMAQKTIQQARTQATFVPTSLFNPTEPFDVALINILWWSDAERGLELIQLAATHVKPGGFIVLAGGKQSGIKGADNLLQQVGSTSSLMHKKGHRLIATERPINWQSPAKPIKYQTIATANTQFEVLDSAGLFNGGNLDDASAMLINVLTLPENARVLDLGCGSGILGMAAKRIQPSIELTLVDSNSRAIQVAQANLAHNNIQGEVILSNGISEIRDRQFDVVITNPPFHIGRKRSEKLAHFFIREALAATVPGGEFWLVANEFLRYEQEIEIIWGKVREITSDSRFKVLQTVRKNPADPNKKH